MLQSGIFIYFSVGLIFGILEYFDMREEEPRQLEIFHRDIITELKSIGLFKFARWLNEERLLLIGCSITTLLWLPFIVMGVVIDIFSNEELD